MGNFFLVAVISVISACFGVTAAAPEISCVGRKLTSVSFVSAAFVRISARRSVPLPTSSRIGEWVAEPAYT